MPRSYRHLALLIVLPASGCITRALWQDDGKSPQLVTLTVPCVAHETRSLGNGIGVTFSVLPEAPAPRHLHRFTADRPGYLELTPLDSRPDWRDQPGSERFTPESWEFRVSRGEHFRRPFANVRMVFHGTMRPDEVGRLLSPAEVRSIVGDAEQMPVSSRALAATAWDARVAEAFRGQPWMELIAGEDPDVTYRGDAMAWIDENGQLAEPPRSAVFARRDERTRIERETMRHELVARLTNDFGEKHWVAIPAHVLFQGADLRLQRRDGVVHWSRRQIWRGDLLEHPPESAADPFPLAMQADYFAYRWSYELVDDRLALHVLRILATPITAALDFLIMTNPYLRNLIEGEPWPDEPKRRGGF